MRNSPYCEAWSAIVGFRELPRNTVWRLSTDGAGEVFDRGIIHKGRNSREILALIQSSGPVTASDISAKTGIRERMGYRYVNSLQGSGVSLWLGHGYIVTH